MTNNGFAVTPSDVEKAASSLVGVSIHTPAVSSHQVDTRVRAKVFFKCENFQHTGAFKFRGAYNAISRLTDAQKDRGVVAYSSGNHAQGIALAAKALGVQATVVMPHDAPQIKMQAAEGYGARIVFYDRARENRESITRELGRRSGATVIASSDHPDVIAGQATVAKELFDDVGPLDYLLVPVGGGGLLAGSAIAAARWSPDCLVIGVEPETGNDAQQSMHAGMIVSIASPATIADGARNEHLGAMAWPIIKAYVSQIVTVTDDQLREQMRFFVEHMKLVVEPTGCLAASAVMNGRINFAGARVGVLVTGGNVDSPDLLQFPRVSKP